MIGVWLRRFTFRRDGGRAQLLVADAGRGDRNQVTASHGDRNQVTASHAEVARTADGQPVGKQACAVADELLACGVELGSVQAIP